MIEKRPEMTGVVGYVDSDVAKALSSDGSKDGSIDLRFEAGNDRILMRVKNADIREVSVGSTEGKESRVQLVLGPGTVVETVVKMFSDVKAIEDPTFTRLTAAANVSVSFV